ncbi:hypothetical protein [Luteimonas deserti]|uniref:Short-chain dehydrogenase n=1 Tax=Luteimonas deserti TaxID=2752306 RepID=A0A7Z0TUV5_9GAMM|nr:hypothetical protein [Luteimonas deserti]NYZ61564.1 hypothetical protein [Luteimonas deserti]
MTAPRKIVLHSSSGLRPGLDRLVAEWIREGVQYVGVVGVDAEDIVDAIDWFCIGDGTAPYEMLTAAHAAPETLDDALALASQVDFPGEVSIVVF